MLLFVDVKGLLAAPGVPAAGVVAVHPPEHFPATGSTPSLSSAVIRTAFLGEFSSDTERRMFSSGNAASLYGLDVGKRRAIRALTWSRCQGGDALDAVTEMGSAAFVLAVVVGAAAVYRPNPDSLAVDPLVSRASRSPVPER